MLSENSLETIVERKTFPEMVLTDGGAAVDRFVAWVDTLGPPAYAGPTLRARVLAELSAVAGQLDAGRAAGTDGEYDRQVLYEIPGRWSLAAIILQPGQATHPHDHGGWGCAVTVQGIERDRRFVHDANGELVLSSERDYRPGEGYTFTADDIHQPFGADLTRVTVGLHFLVHGGEH